MCRTALKKHVAAFKYLYTTCFADRKHSCESGTIYSGPSATFVSAGSRSGTNPIILNIFGNSLEIPYTDCKFTRNNYNQSTRRINQLVNYKNIASKFLFNEINSCMITFFVFFVLIFAVTFFVFFVFIFSGTGSKTNTVIPD